MLLLQTKSWVNERHVITGAEAAYAALIGVWLRGYGVAQWCNNGVPHRRELWPVTLLTAQAHVVETGGKLRHAMGVKLLEVVESAADPVVDIAAGFQSGASKVVWEGERPIDYGFGLVVWPPLTATDVIFARFSYVSRLP